jgi:hypothetical protein
MDVLKPHVRDLGGGLMVSRVLPGRTEFVPLPER